MHMTAVGCWEVSRHCHAPACAFSISHDLSDVENEISWLTLLTHTHEGALAVARF